MYIVILVIECITIYFLFPETKGLTLEQVGHLLDDDSTIQAASVGKDPQDAEQVEYMDTKH